jgi:transporter family protein
MTYILFGLLSGFAAALVALFGKLGLKGFDSVLATTLRSIIMMLCMLVFSIGLQRFDTAKIVALQSKDWLWIAAAGFAGALSWLFYFEGLSMGPMSKMVALDRLSLVFALVMSALFLGEEISALKWVGAGLMVIGSILIVR